MDRSPPLGNSKAGEEWLFPPLPSPLAVIGSASLCPWGPGSVAMYGTPLSPVFAVNAPLRPESGLISASVAKNPTTSRPPMAAVISVSTCSRDGFGLRSSRREVLARKCRIRIRVRSCKEPQPPREHIIAAPIWITHESTALGRKASIALAPLE